MDRPGWTDRQVVDSHWWRTRTLEDAQHPVGYMDEQPVRLVREKRESLPTTENHPQRVDYECKPESATSLLIENLAGHPVTPIGVQIASTGQICHERGSSEGTLRRRGKEDDAEIPL